MVDENVDVVELLVDVLLELLVEVLLVDVLLVLLLVDVLLLDVLLVLLLLLLLLLLLVLVLLVLVLLVLLLLDVLLVEVVVLLLDVELVVVVLVSFDVFDVLSPLSRRPPENTSETSRGEQLCDSSDGVNLLLRRHVPSNAGIVDVSGVSLVQSRTLHSSNLLRHCNRDSRSSHRLRTELE